MIKKPSNKTIKKPAKKPAKKSAKKDIADEPKNAGTTSLGALLKAKLDDKK